MGGVGSALGSVVGGLTGGFAQAAGLNQNNIASPVTPAELQQAMDQQQAAQAQQQAFVNALNGVNGIQNQQNVFNQMQGVANGTGPNPAQAQLAQATGANVANQAALIAGQRGANSNVGLAARNAANAGVGAQQQAAGQAATLQAQQSLNAMNNMGNIAGSQVNQQQAGLQGLQQGALTNQSNMLNAQQGANQINAGIQTGNATRTGNLIGNVMGAAGTALAGANGGMVPQYADGGPVQPMDPMAPQIAPAPDMTGPQSSFGRQLHGLPPVVPNQAMIPPQTMMAEGGKVPAMVSPGEQYIPPKDLPKVAKGADPLSVGERIPGTPKVKGNSYANDTVPKTLDAGGVVIPNSVMQSKDPSGNAAKFISDVMARHGNPMDAIKKENYKGKKPKKRD